MKSCIIIILTWSKKNCYLFGMLLSFALKENEKKEKKRKKFFLDAEETKTLNLVTRGHNNDVILYFSCDQIGPPMIKRRSNKQAKRVIRIRDGD